jgi:hypothetical protein
VTLGAFAQQLLGVIESLVPLLRVPSRARLRDSSTTTSTA